MWLYVCIVKSLDSFAAHYTYVLVSIEIELIFFLVAGPSADFWI